jgi:hypothetical protein
MTDFDYPNEYTFQKGYIVKITAKTPKKRIIWGFDPVTRTVPSKKSYSRKGIKVNIKKEF